MSEEPLLRPEEVSSVLSESDQTEPAPDGEPKPYSLREPLAIPPQKEKLAEEKLRQIALALRETIEAELGMELDLQLDGLQQQRASAVLAAIPPPAWVLTLSRPTGGGVSFALHPLFALSLVDFALGGSGGTPGTAREPTPVESGVLGQLMAAATQQVGKVLGESLRVEAPEVGRVPRCVAAAGETVAVGLLRVRLGESDHTSLIVATAGMLLPAVGRAAGSTSNVGCLASRLDRVPVRVRPVLTAGRVGLRDLMELEPDNLLRLDASEDSLLELRIAGHAVFWGRARRDDEQPVFIVERRRGRPATNGEHADE